MSKVNVYEIVFSGIDLSNHSDYVLADNFNDACRKAQYLLVGYKKEWTDATIVKVSFLCEITEA